MLSGPETEDRSQVVGRNEEDDYVRLMTLAIVRP